MPFGGNDWLGLTAEAPLEPELPICDPHHHLWDLRPARIPYQRYQLDELLADISGGHDVRSTVFIECRSMYRSDGPAEMRPVGEVEYVQGQAAASASGLYGPARIAAAIVGHANLNLGERVQPVLEALKAASPNRFRGIRHSVTWDPHPEIENTAAHQAEGQLRADAFRAGARVLARMGLTLEGWLFESQLLELAAFAKAVPELTIVLDHCGGVLRTGPYAARREEAMENWRKGIAAVAQCPNVVVKLGGLGMVRCGFDWHTRETPLGSEALAAAMAPYLSHCIEQFTPARCMFESNFPVDKVSYSYNVMWNAFKRFSKSYSQGERAAMFHDTAARIYRIEGAHTR
jgi:predicted TIM-barrel fold metal-dependent hydrolase